MDPAFQLMALITLGAAVAAVTLRNLIHCALCLVVVFLSVAGLFLLLGAEFLSFAQVLIYVGAIAILIVFVTLLTRNTERTGGRLFFAPWIAGVGIAGVVTGAVVACLLTSRLLPKAAAPSMAPTVRRIGEELVTHYVLPLEIVGLLLTAALIGAVVLAVREPPAPGDGKETTQP